MDQTQLKLIIDAVLAAVDKQTAGHPVLNLGVHVIRYIVDDTALLDEILAGLKK